MDIIYEGNDEEYIKVNNVRKKVNHEKSAEAIVLLICRKGRTIYSVLTLKSHEIKSE